MKILLPLLILFIALLIPSFEYFHGNSGGGGGHHGSYGYRGGGHYSGYSGGGGGWGWPYYVWPYYYCSRPYDINCIALV